MNGSRPMKLLDESHRKEIDRTLLRVHKLMPAIEAAEQCGVDCTEFRQQAEYLTTQLKAVLDTIFPGTSTALPSGEHSAITAPTVPTV